MANASIRIKSHFIDKVFSCYKLKLGTFILVPKEKKTLKSSPSQTHTKQQLTKNSHAYLLQQSIIIELGELNIENCVKKY